MLIYIFESSQHQSTEANQFFELFLNADGYPITHDAVEKMFHRVKKTDQVDKLHPHACRHTFNVRYLIYGGDAYSLQKILGHTSLEANRKYVNLASGGVKEKHRLGDDGGTDRKRPPILSPGMTWRQARSAGWDTC